MDLDRTLRRMLLPCCLLWVGIAHAEMTDAVSLPRSTWRALEAVPAIRTGGRPGVQSSVQVVCDANCPNCAKLHRTLRQDYPALSVRWLLLAYFKPESDALGAAILGSADPAASLGVNYRGYDFKTQRGAYRPPAGRQWKLAPAHAALKQQWMTLGGFTPMVIIRTRDGDIIQAQGSTAPFLRAALRQAAPAAKGLEAWRPDEE